MIKRAPSGHRCGESHQRAKLTDKQVIAMRQQYDAWKAACVWAGYGRLAKMFGCSASTARDIVTYRTRYFA